MIYMGSKNRIAKYILPIILKDRQPGQWYVEPFCGGCNSIDKVDGNRIANDSNEYLIAFLQYLSNLPSNLPYITEELYKDIQQNKHKYENWLVGYAAFSFSFGGKYFGGYRRDKKGIDKKDNEAIQNQARSKSLLKQSVNLHGIKFYNVNYSDLVIPNNSIIYCDPPYRGTTKYKDDFDHDKFWEWCREKVKEGHAIYVSEYNAPDDFKCVWEMELTNSLSMTTHKPIERLFYLEV